MNTSTHRPPHPGSLLRAEIEKRGITATSFAGMIEMSRMAVSMLVNEHKAMTLEMALRLERVLGIPAEKWLFMQQSLDLYEARMNSFFDNIQSLDTPKKSRFEAATV